MKKLILILTILLFTQLSYSQWYGRSGLQQTDPVPPDWDSLKIKFINTNTGWLTRFRDSVFKTTDGGLNWVGYTTVDTNILSSVSFINSNYGWTCGRRGKICRTTNGGISWALQYSGVLSWANPLSILCLSYSF